VSLPFVVVVERSAGVITRGLKLKNVAHGGHSAEELKLIVSSSRGLGYLPESQEDMIHRVLDLDYVVAREVMVRATTSFRWKPVPLWTDVLRTMIAEKHSRPARFYRGSPEKIVGILHYKDLLPVWEERRRAIRSGQASRSFHIGRLLRPHLVVPETKPLSQMLEQFRAGHSHMAMVVDEFGTIVGMLTLKDVLEHLVGRIEDEHDEKDVRRDTYTGEIELDGATRIRDLETEFGHRDPVGCRLRDAGRFSALSPGRHPARRRPGGA